MSAAQNQQAAPAIVRPSVLKGSLKVEQVQPALGAEISNIDISDVAHDHDLRDEIERLWLQHKVLFFRDQEVTHAAHQAFAASFGELDIHPTFKGGIPEAPALLQIWNNKPDSKPKPFFENIWHSDVTFLPTPVRGSVLRMIEGPAVGGDTLWCNMALLYEKLPADVKAIIETLYARHTPDVLVSALPVEERRARLAKSGATEHPVVLNHPITGERVLFVNRAFTTSIANYYSTTRVRYGADFYGSEDLLRYLTSKVLNPEFQVRFKWRPNSIVMWDNILTQHYAVMDYTESRRMVRATIKGRPLNG